MRGAGRHGPIWRSAPAHLEGIAMSKIIKRALAALLAGLIATESALACTRVLWAAPDGQVFVGRTQDWTERANSAFRVFPRGIERVGAVAENPHRWTSRYGSIILTGYDAGTHEGVNERGLAGHLLYLAAESAFGERDPRREAIGVLQWVQYHLDNFATVAEAVAAQRGFTFQIEPMILPNGFPTLVHLALSDRTGDSAVIEYVNGQARIYHDRRHTVMTNEPTFDRQIENLRRYRGFGGDLPLPGERSPTDRFVRAASYANGLPRPADRTEAAAFMFSVIRNVSVPFGMGEPGRPNVSSTIFRSVMDLTGGRYFFESTYAPNVVWIDHDRLDFSQGRAELELRVEQRIFSLAGEVSGQLQQAAPFVFARSDR